MLEVFKQPALIKVEVDGIMQTREGKSEIESLKNEHAVEKVTQLEKVRKEGKPKYTSDQFEEMVN